MRHDGAQKGSGPQLAKGTQVIMRAPGDAHMRALADLLEERTTKAGWKVVLLSTLHSAPALQRKLPLSKVPNGSVKVIDTVSLGFGAASSGTEGFVFLQTPASLESILASIERAFSGKGAFDALVVDSLDTFSSRFPFGPTIEFFRYLQVRMAERDAAFIVMDRSRGPPGRLQEELSSILDTSIDLSPGGDGG